MPLRIGFDLDGVLADMEAELVRHAEALFPEPPAEKTQDRAAEPNQSAVSTDELSADGKPLARLNISLRQQRRLWRHVASIENFWETLQEIEPGATRRLAALASERRWELIFLTKRSETAGATAQVQSQRWLESKGFVLPSVYVVQGSRGQVAAALALDIVVDDRAESCLDVVVDSKARAILVWREDESQLPTAARRLGIGVVRSVTECLDLLAQVDSSGEEAPGIMARLMRALGLKEPISHV